MRADQKDSLHWLHEHLRTMQAFPNVKAPDGGPDLKTRLYTAMKLVERVLKQDTPELDNLMQPKKEKKE